MTNNEKDRMIASLEKLGLSTYEARTYLAALCSPPITGYKLSKLSGVPRSRIYETIEKLTGRGLLVFQSSDKKLLTAVDFKAFLDMKEQDNRSNIDYLRESLPQLRSTETVGIWNIEGREQVINAVKDMIIGAKEYVYMSLFDKDLLELKESILAAQQKNIQVWGVFCGENNLNLDHFYPHLGSSCNNCQEICVSVDGTQSLMGCTYPEESASAALTQNNGFINITEGYIKHEIFINRQFAQQGREAIKRYIEQYDQTMSQLP